MVTFVLVEARTRDRRSSAHPGMESLSSMKLLRLPTTLPAKKFGGVARVTVAVYQIVA